MAAVEQPLADYGPSHADSLEKRLRHLRGAEDEAHASLLQAVLGSEASDQLYLAQLIFASAAGCCRQCYFEGRTSCAPKCMPHCGQSELTHLERRSTLS